MSEDEREKVAKEVENLSKLKNLTKHIVEYYHSWCSADKLFIQMGYCENGTMMKLISDRNGERLQVLRVITYFCQLMDAIKHCHAKKLVHKDIKPDNLMLTKDGNVLQLGDFGLSQVQEHSAKSMRTVDPDGFAAYLAPELLKLPEVDSNGEYGLKYDHKVDIWSCGAILYELFHLKMMWFKWPPKPLPRGLVHHLIRGRVLANEHEEFALDCPAAIKRLVQQCCNQSPASRPEASELFDQAAEIKELIEIGQGSTKSTVPSADTNGDFNNTAKPSQQIFTTNLTEKASTSSELSYGEIITLSLSTTSSGRGRPLPTRCSSKKVHSLGRNIWHCPWPVEQISTDEFVISSTYNRQDGSGSAALVTTLNGQRCNMAVDGSSIYTVCKISENRFVAGTKSGQVVIQSGVSIEKSVELFENSVQEKNATLVQYTSNRIYAVAEESSLTLLNMSLEVVKVLGPKVEKEVLALVATQDYVALGGVDKKVTVYDEFGNLALEYNHRHLVNSISISGNLIASGSCDQFCTVWNISKKRRLYAVKNGGHVNQVQLFSPGHSFDLMISSYDGSVKVCKEGKVIQTLEHSNGCYRFQLNTEKTLLAVGYRDGLALWSTADWSKLADQKIGHIVDVHFNSTSTKVIAADRQGEVSVIDLE